MNMIHMRTAALVASVAVCTACGGAQKTEDALARPDLVDAGALVETYARWLPGDALGVGVFAVDSTVDFLATRQVTDTDPERGEKIEARKRALRADISKITASRFGIDLAGAHTVVVGVGPTTQTVILLGAKAKAEDAIDVSGVQAFQIAPRQPADEELMKDIPLTSWAAELPDKKGVVLFLNRPQLNALARSENMSLAASNTLAEYVETLNRHPSRIAFATSVGGPLQAFASEIEEEVGFAPPRFGAFVLGDEMTLLLRGDAGDLERLDEMRQELMETGTEAAKESYGTRAEADSASAFGATFAYHAMLGLDEALLVELADGELSYSAPGGLGSYWVVGGIGAAIAIPAFLRSVKKSKSSESESMMRKLTDGSKAYFTSEQKYDVSQPWHTGGEPGYPIPWNEYTFPGGTDFTFQSSAEIPTEGSKVMPSIPDDPLVEAALNKLNIVFNDPTYFRYTITTGPGRGQDAKITITAEADFKPGGPVHTVTQEVFVDATSQEVIVTPAFTMNEFE